MRSNIITLISTLLLSSVPTQSSTIFPRDAGINSNSAKNSVHVQISVTINGQRWNSDQDGTCPKKENNCFTGKKSSSKFSFKCGKKYFSESKVTKAASAGCPEISKNSQRHVYPAAYDASSYEIEGPYWEWPISRNGRFWNKWSRSKYRIVFTEDCTVVGAVIRNKRDHSYKQCDPWQG